MIRFPAGPAVECAGGHQTFMILFDYVVEPLGRSPFRTWWKGLQKAQRGQLLGMIDLLRMADADLAQGLIDGTAESGVFKLKVGGKVRLRPLLCRGPVDASQEVTFLLGATERDFQLVPRGAEAKAAEYRDNLRADPRLRETHERITIN